MGFDLTTDYGQSLAQIASFKVIAPLVTGSLNVSSGTLDGVTLNGDINVGNSSTVDIKDGLTLSNSNVTLGNSSSMYFQGTQTLGGTGQIVFGGGSSTGQVYAQGGNSVATAATLTIGPNVTVNGGGGGQILRVLQSGFADK